MGKILAIFIVCFLCLTDAHANCILPGDLDVIQVDRSNYELSFLSKRASMGDEEASLILFVYDMHIKREGVNAIKWLKPIVFEKGYEHAKLAYVDAVVSFPGSNVRDESIEKILRELMVSENHCISANAMYLLARYFEINRKNNYKCYYQRAAFEGSYMAMKSLQSLYSKYGDTYNKKKHEYWRWVSVYSENFWVDGGNTDDLGFIKETGVVFGELYFKNKNDLKHYKDNIVTLFDRDIEECM